MTNTELSSFLGHWLPRLEGEMRELLASHEPAVAAHYAMMQYHMGWLDEHFRPHQAMAGKRLRPILCLLGCAEVGGDPVQALPAAAAIEILHNFSLIHDDIEDGDETRRGRPTLWALWGMPQAINVGDGMFALAFAALQRSSRRGVAAEQTLAALDLFTQTCLALTEGQHLDIGFEQRTDVTVDEYLRMIQGKTAALVGGSIAIGALIGGAPREQAAGLQRFGHAVGLAFQIQDDILGIWGDPAVTGKPAGNDILRRKKSLPILYTLRHAQTGADFAAVLAGTAERGQLRAALGLLEQSGARSFAEREAQRQHEEAIRALEAALGEQAGGSALRALAESLLNRRA